MTSYSTQNQWPGSNTFKLSFLLGPLLRCLAAARKTQKGEFREKTSATDLHQFFTQSCLWDGWMDGALVLFSSSYYWNCGHHHRVLCVSFSSTRRSQTQQNGTRESGGENPIKQLFFSSFRDPLLWLNNKKGDESMHYQSQQQPTSW